MRASETGGLLFKLTFHNLLQLFQAIETQILRQFIVNLGFGFDLYCLHSDVKSRFLTSKVFSLIIRWESNGDGFLIAFLGANQLFFKAGDESTGPNHKRSVFGFAAFKLFAVKLTDEVDNQLVAIGSLLGLGGILITLVLTRNISDRFLNLRVADRDNQLFELQTIGAGCFDFWKHFKLDCDFSIIAFLVFLAQRDRRLHRGAQLFILDQCVD